MRKYWLQYLLNLVLPLALIFFAWGCGGVAIQVDAPHKKTPRPSTSPWPITKPPLTR